MLATAAFGAIGFRRRLPEGHAAQPSRAVRALQVRRADRRRRSASASRSLWLADHNPPALQHAADLSVLQGAAFRISAGWYVPVRGVRARQHDERRESDRRARRSGDQHVRRGGRDVHGADLRHRPRAVRAVPADSCTSSRPAELTIFCGALVGASLGFLWWNAHPADIFMGDVGSLALGGALGTVAILIKQELLLPIVGGVFVHGRPVGDHPGRVVQAHRQARVPDGAAASPLRAHRLGGAEDHHAGS